MRPKLAQQFYCLHRENQGGRSFWSWSAKPINRYPVEPLKRREAGVTASNNMDIETVHFQQRGDRSQLPLSAADQRQKIMDNHRHPNRLIAIRIDCGLNSKISK